MTNKDKVLERWPDAVCGYFEWNGDSIWSVEVGEGWQMRQLGWGRTAKEAWASAAERAVGEIG